MFASTLCINFSYKKCKKFSSDEPLRKYHRIDNVLRLKGRVWL